MCFHTLEALVEIVALHNTTHTKRKRGRRKKQKKKKIVGILGILYFLFFCGCFFFMCLVLNLVEYKRVQNKRLKKKERGFHDEQRHLHHTTYTSLPKKKTYILCIECKPVCTTSMGPLQT
jgi:ABC-type Fe3+ transport system permease subunit